MKTQLLQDIDESGSADLPLPAPAVWHRPQAQGPAGASMRRGAGQMRPPGAGSMQGGAGSAASAAAAAPASRQHAAQEAWMGPRPVPGEARARAQPGTHTARQAPPPPAGEMPAWLAERLREDAERDAERQRSRLWGRRALAWSGAATVAAMLAAAGLWWYQESRVEGALVVVANTSPAPTLIRSAPPAPVTPSAAAPIAPAPAAAENSARAPAEAAPLGSIDAPPRKPAAQHRPHRQAAARAAKPARTEAGEDGGPSPVQRREETLMQCRALGYDERQCARRGCAMTRFGLACRG